MADDKVIVEIEVGNAEMESVYDIAEALRTIAARIDDGQWRDNYANKVMDVNGNRVGFFRLPEGMRGQ